LKRRDLLKGAALAAAVRASEALASGSPAPAADPSSAQSLGKIALEEHFMVPEFVPYFAETFQNISPEIAKLAPIALEDYDRRIAIMDQYRVDFVVLSLSGPGVQVEKDAAIAIKRSKSVNDYLATQIQKRPARFGGFAHLPMQNPREAADELERCVRDLGFQGAMINGQTNGE
jgi:2,3-dihydroxybenzoate decarboxylase